MHISQLELEDMHVHSTFSDGRDSILDNVSQAARLGLRRLTCVDHVRKDSRFVPDFVKEVRRVQAETSLDLFIGVEAKILDGCGQLDVPSDLSGVDYIYAADHQLPMGTGCYKPTDIRRQLAEGTLGAAEVVLALVDATMAVLFRYPRIVLAHLFSVLPKVGLAEDSVPLRLLGELAEAARAAGAAIEVDERWECPGPRTLRIFHRAGVPIFLSTDSHAKGTIGAYRYATETMRQVLG